MEREVIALLKRAVDDLTATTRDLARYQLASEKAAAARGADQVRLLGEVKTELGKIREAVSAVDEGLDVVATATAQTSAAAKSAAKKPGLFLLVTAWLDKNPTLKMAVVVMLVQLIGYVTFWVTGLPVTPSPMQIAPPATVVLPAAGHYGALAPLEP